MSGKLNEFINLFVGGSNPATCRGDQRWLEAQPPAGTIGFVLFKRALDTSENETAGGTPFSGGEFMQAAVDVPRQIN
jgi:hypothetical protein